MRLWVIDTLAKALTILLLYMIIDTIRSILTLSMSVNWVG